MAKKETQTNSSRLANIWTKVCNPLRTLNQAQIDRMLDNARYGNDVKLQVCYWQCEKSNPIFSACINKRIAGVQNRQWDIVPINDSEEARIQTEAIKKMFLESDNRVDDNLTDAIRHLTMAAFRGRAAVKPFIDENGKLIWKKLNNWNFISYDGKQYWNPDAVDTFLLDKNQINLPEIPKDEICYVIEDKEADWIGITIYLRQLIGEEQFARIIEKQGIPQVILTAPEGTPEDELEKYNYRAQAIYEGASGVIPFGTEPHEMTAGRTPDPFMSYLQHQSELFCILTIGGTLDVLAGTAGSSGTGMGSSTSDNQKSQFDSLVSYDCKRIQNALQIAVKKCIQNLGYNKILCRFEYVEKTEDIAPEKYIEMAVALKNLGIAIDTVELKRLTKLSFISDDTGDVWQPQKENV